MRLTAQIKNSESGFALVEVLLAFGVALIIITGMVSLGVATVRSTTTSRASAEAGRISQREVERLKLLRENSANWTAFLNSISGCGWSACYLIPSGTTYARVSGSTTSGSGVSAITYFFNAVGVSGNEIKYTVTTNWNVGTSAKTYIVEGGFSNWDK